MTWRDFFYFNKGERTGIIILVVLILLVLMLPSIHKRLAPHNNLDFGNFEAAAIEFQSRLEENRLQAEREREERRSSRQFSPRPSRGSSNQEVKLEPFRFNPNNLPMSEWLRMGMPDHIVTRIHNYEKAGGSFRYREDLARIYSISDEVFMELESFIDLPSRSEASDRTTLAGDESRERIRRQETEVQAVVELNAADSTQLVSVRGIGPAFSRRIISYREWLGGYTELNQLMEVFGMDTTRFFSIKNRFEIDISLVRKINLNNSEWSDLVRHPYIDANLATSLIAMRKQHGNYETVEDIKRSALVNDSLFSKISPYLVVE